MLNAKRKKIALIITFTSPAGVVENHIEHIAAGFTLMNFEPVVLNVSAPDLQARLQSLDFARIGVAFCFTPKPLKLELNNQKLYEFFQCPFFVYSLDHPVHDFQRYPELLSYFEAAKSDLRLHLGFADKDYAALYSRIWKAAGRTKEIAFTPMAGFFANPMTVANAPRQRAIAVIGNLNALPVDGAIEGKTLEETIDNNLIARVSDAQKQAFVDTLRAPDFMGNVPEAAIACFELAPERLLDRDFIIFAGAVDSFVKLDMRQKVVSSLKGLPVHFIGALWKEYLGEQPDFTYFGYASHYDLPEILCQYECVVNFDPNFANGVHDRLLTGLASGAKVITNRNSYIETIPDAGRAVWTYSLNSPDIFALSEEALNTELEPGFGREILAHHSWGQRIRDVLEHMAE